MLERGHPIKKANLWDGSRIYEIADFTVLEGHTKYPFALNIPQHLTERVLGERVQEEGIHLRRPFKVVDVKANKLDRNYADVVFEDGQVVQARYVIGADGARSTVRTLSSE